MENWNTEHPFIPSTCVEISSTINSTKQQEGNVNILKTKSIMSFGSSDEKTAV